jgi:hypothetical protein
LFSAKSSLRDECMIRIAAMSGAERQRRWRDRRNALAKALTGSPAVAATTIITELGIDNAHAIGRALLGAKPTKRRKARRLLVGAIAALTLLAHLVPTRAQTTEPPKATIPLYNPTSSGIYPDGVDPLFQYKAPLMLPPPPIPRPPLPVIKDVPGREFS